MDAAGLRNGVPREVRPSTTGFAGMYAPPRFRGSAPLRVASLLLGVTVCPVPTHAQEAKAARPAPRLRAALANTQGALERHFTELGLAFPPREVFLRAFKHERELELWAKSARGEWILAKTFPVCMASGEPGPKREFGDLQVPEGFYHIDRFNPWSDFHLSLGINYPNESDRILGVRGRLGGNIFIHGSCVSVGCLAITDPMIEELFTAAWLARGRGQRNIPVHIFPARMDGAAMTALRAEADEGLVRFWEDLEVGYRWFEEKRRLPRIQVLADGRYRFRDERGT